MGAPVCWRGGTSPWRLSAGGLSYRGPRWRLDGLSLSLRGLHQRQNAAVALAALEQLDARGLASRRRRRGRGSLGALARTIRGGGRAPPVLLDGAHNPSGVAVLLASLDSLYPGRRIHAVFGVVADKDRAPMMRAPLPAPRLPPPHAPGHAALPGSRALPRGCPLSVCGCAAYASLDEALAGARARAMEGDVILCTGSLFLVGAARARLAGNLGAMQQRQ